MPHQALICRGCGNEVGLQDLETTGERSALVCPTCAHDDFGI